MKTITIRDFRTRPAEARKLIAEEAQSVLTVSGKPIALMIPVDSESLEDVVEALKIGRGQKALRALREEARGKGLEKLSAEDIEAVIQDVRRSRTRSDSKVAE